MRLDSEERVFNAPPPAWRIRRIRGDAETRFQRYVCPEPMSGCHLWAGGLFPTGYGIFWFSEDNPAARAHVVAWEFVNGPVPDGLDVCHTCDVRCCVNPDHLYVGTRKQNMADAIARGRMPRGDKTWHRRMPEKIARGPALPQAKLTEADVIAIRASNKLQRELAEQYGVSRCTISEIRARKYWTHI